MLIQYIPLTEGLIEASTEPYFTPQIQGAEKTRARGIATTANTTNYTRDAWFSWTGIITWQTGSFIAIFHTFSSNPLIFFYF